MYRPESRSYPRRGLFRLAAGGLSVAGCAGAARNTHRVWLAGDLHLGDRVGEPSGFLSRLPGAGFVNLEGPIADTPGWSPGPGENEIRLANHPDTLAWMRRSGIRGASLLNNHRLDAGAEGLTSTASQLHAAKLISIDQAQSPEPASYGPWRFFSAYLGKDTSIGLARADLLAIQRQRSPSRTLVVSLHVDAPPSYLPSPALRNAVAQLRRAGAQVIALHGSHVLGPVTRDKDCLVAWGLGNLSFACPCSQEKEGLILAIERSPNAELQAELIPISVGSPTQPIGAARDSAATFELLTALESSPMKLRGQRAHL